MPTRSRTRSFTQSRGFYGSFTGQVPSYYSKCDDTVGAPRIDHPLTITRNTGDFPKVSGTQQSNGKVVNNFIMDANTVYTVVPGFTTGPLNQGNAVTKTLAYTNPNRPGPTDWPVFFKELKDIPRMYKHIAGKFNKIALTRYQHRLSPRDYIKFNPKNFTREVGNDVLAIQFGYLPFVRDMANLLKFIDGVDKRIEELQRLYSSGGLRRRFNLFQNFDVLQGTAVLQSSNFSCTARYVRTRKQIQWATVRWRPTVSNLPPKTEKGMKALAFNAYTGLNVDFSTAYEAMPWSWMIDWFANVGECFAASRNRIPVKPENMCIMNWLEGRYDYTSTTTLSAGLKFAPGFQTTTVKTRAVVPAPNPSLEAGLPFLSAAQVTILGALSATRFLK